MTRIVPEGSRRLSFALATTLVAGLVGLSVHSVLMLVKDALDILPGFQPYEDFQRLLGRWSGDTLAGMLPYLTGAMIWGFLYARLHDHLPGRHFWTKGLAFAVIAWAAMTTGFFLLAGHGVLGLGLDYGLWPAALMFPMLAAFSLALSFTHSRLRADDDRHSRPKPSRNREPYFLLNDKELPMQTFNLPTMSCGHCEKTVREAIAALDPEATVDVDLKTRTVRVESAVDRDRIADALKARGYPAD